MERVIVLVALATLSYGIQYDGLRVKFGWSDAMADIKYFFNIPRTMIEVENEGWRRTERPPGPLKELRMYCPPGRGVCPLYDTAGFVAGLQIAFPVDEYDYPELKPEKKFVKWHAGASQGEPAREYWTATQYYVSEDSLKAGAGPQVQNGATLQDGGVWVTGLNGKLMRIPISEVELKTTLFQKQNCVPKMGTHYYYNFTKDFKCEHLLPWFVIVTEGELVGVGFQTFGKPPVSKQRDWFESVPTIRQAALITVPSAPECYLDLAEKYGLMSTHIYLIKDPWRITCKTGDSMKPASALDRLMFNGYRYANQVNDELQKLFSG